MSCWVQLYLVELQFISMLIFGCSCWDAVKSTVMELFLPVKSVVKCVRAQDATGDNDTVRAINDCPVESSRVR